MSDYSSSPYYSTALAAASQYGIPGPLFVAQIGQESGFNPNAQNGNASGIAQFMPSTAAQYGVNSADPTSSLFGAAAYDAKLYSQYGSWQSALQHYGTTANGAAPALDAAAAQADNPSGIPTFTQTLDAILQGIIHPLDTVTGNNKAQMDADVKSGKGPVSSVGTLLGIVTDLPRMATLVVGLILLLAGLFMLGNRTIVTAVQGLQRATS